MPEVHADGALWRRARKGWFSGTRVQFSMGSCPKRVVFRHEGPVFYVWGGARKVAVSGTGVDSVRPEVPKHPVRGRDMQR